MKKNVQYAYAKINLHLDITGIMPNGFHSVNNVMQTVSLCDTVTLTERADGEITVDCDIESVPKGKDNLAYRAAALFCEAVGRRIGADIYIEKRIPMAAGLAGGSADAAAVLRGLNELCDRPLSADELCAIGGKLGSDIPFCIVGGSAFADGKGDILHPFPAMPDCALVVACGGEGVSTPEAYRMLDTKYERFVSYAPAGISQLRRAVESGSIADIAKNIFNIFEQPVLSVRPVAAAIKSAMLEGGARCAMMSGSGPSVFGIFTDAKSAERAAELIRDLGVQPHICRPKNGA